MLWSYENTFCVQRKQKHQLYSAIFFPFYVRLGCAFTSYKYQNGRRRNSGEKNGWVNGYFLFCLRKKNYSCSVAKWKLSHWCHHGLFYRCFYYVSGPGNISVAFLSMGLRALWFHQKHLHLCSEDERRSWGFGTTWGWIINDRILILGWTIPLKGMIHGATFWALLFWHFPIEN